MNSIKIQLFRHENIILDNHDVAIEAYNDTYISEGMLIKEQEMEYIEIIK